MNFNHNQEDWQQALIETNLLIIGYNAWNGYLKTGRGVIICTTDSPSLTSVGETFNCHYIPRPRLASFLNAWLATPDTVILRGHHLNSHILEAADNYNPQRDVILMLESAKKVSFYYVTLHTLTFVECRLQIVFRLSKYSTKHLRILEKNHESI